MNGLNDEETIEWWTRGDLHGEWTITDNDLDTIYQEPGSVLYLGGHCFMYESIEKRNSSDKLPADCYN